MRYRAMVSSESLTLRVHGVGPVPPTLWRTVWRIGWARIAKIEPASASAWRAAYFEDLLPDQESRLMELASHVDEDGLWAMTFTFPDFGGHFSSTITLLVDWLALALADQYAAVHDAIAAAGFTIDAEHLPRLGTPAPRTVIAHEERLFLVHRDADGLVTLTADGGAPPAPERARTLLETGATEDPIRQWAQFVASERNAQRAEHERTWMKERTSRLVASLGTISDAALLDAMLTRHRDPAAAAWIETKGAPIARVSASVLGEHLREGSKHVTLALLARALPSARARDADALAALVGPALDDPELFAAALAIDLEDRHRDAAFFARLTALAGRLDGAGWGRIGAWVMGALERRWPKTQPAPALAPLVAALLDRGHESFERALTRRLDLPSWTGDGPLEDPVERAVIARALAHDASLFWLARVMGRRSVGPATEGGIPQELAEHAIARSLEAGPDAARWIVEAWAARKPKKRAPADALEGALRRACIALLGHHDPEVRLRALDAIRHHRLAQPARARDVVLGAIDAGGDPSAMAELRELARTLGAPSPV